MRCNRLFPALILAAATACLPVASGDYEPRSLVNVEQAIPVEVRSVTVLEASRDISDNSFEPIAFDERETARIERELREAVAADLRASGPFRAPGPGEPAYLLDVEFERLSMPARHAAIGTQMLAGLTLGVTLLLGVPYGVLGKEGQATFHLYAPDGSTLVHESIVDVKKSHALGLYYGRHAPIGTAAEPLVRKFKREVADRSDDVLAGEMVAMKQPLLGKSPSMFARGESASPSAATMPTLLSVTPQAANYAIVIGIERYRDVPPADGAEADARRVEALLRTTFGLPGDHVQLLTGDHATKSDVEKALRWVTSEAKRGSRILFYYSGHGAPDPAEGTPYLVPYDGDPDDLDHTAVRMSDVVATLDDSDAREVVVIVDACFSGGGGRSVIAKGVKPLVPADKSKVPPEVVMISAASGSQIASATADGDGGLLTHYLIEALGQGRADIDGDGSISAAELQNWLTPRVEQAAGARGREQRPVFKYGKSVRDPGAFVLGWGYPTP